MKFSLVICTYMRAKPLLRLLQSVREQSLYPGEILIIDGSQDIETKSMIAENSFKNLQYFLVADENRGLTKQRNFGISKVGNDMEIVCFLDDDTVLETQYFGNIIGAFKRNPDAIGVGGVAINEIKWQPNATGIKKSAQYYVFGDYVIKESSRNYLRNILGLEAGKLPNVMPEFSHGRTYSYPLTGKDYPVDMIVGMSMSFRKTVFDHVQFSTYFEGYGLYEDADFCLRALRYGQNYIATSAQLSHYHDESGRPNKYKYGKMVVRNGWYVWRVKNPKPSFHAVLKWHVITILLAIIRFFNIFTTRERKAAFTETLGRIAGWWSLIFNTPKP
ncbi:MAG TPA: glycosyltransferase [Flavobacterium sp.]|nr:glycosyltransferase [Flavobacterium sp.]